MFAYIKKVLFVGIMMWNLLVPAPEKGRHESIPDQREVIHTLEPEKAPPGDSILLWNDSGSENFLGESGFEKDGGE